MKIRKQKQEFLLPLNKKILKTQTKNAKFDVQSSMEACKSFFRKLIHMVAHQKSKCLKIIKA